MAQPVVQPTLGELARASLRIGCLGFGGPAGQIALMHRIFVDEERWIEEARFLHALNYCMLLPGPEAQQLATYVGWLLQGVRGGVVAGVLFVLPGALVVLGLSWLYAVHAQAPLVAALFFGVKAAVLGFVTEALIKVGRRALTSGFDLAIAGAALAALYLFASPFPLVIFAAALLGLLRARSARVADEGPHPARMASTSRDAFVAAALSAIAWLTPPGLSLAVLGPNHVLTRIGLLFSQLAMVTFGGAYAVLAYLQQQAVDTQGWLSAGQMIDGLGLAETTPGPLILVNQFVGFLAGWQATAGGPGLAVATAAMASWCTFAPSFLWIFAGAPFAERLRANRLAAGALAAITAAVLGVIANLAIWFGSHVIFTRDLPARMPWGRVLQLPDPSSVDPFALAIAVAAAIALTRFKVNVILVVASCAVAGVGVTLLR